MTAAHSTVSFVPVTHREQECPACHAALLVPLNAEGVQYCRACQRAHQDDEAGRIASAVRALAAGEGPCFDLLNEDDRKVHLSQISTAVAYARLQLAKGDAGAEASILAGPVSLEAQAIAYAHYVSTADDAPSFEEREAIYAVEALLDAEEQQEAALSNEDSAGSEWR